MTKVLDNYSDWEMHTSEDTWQDVVRACIEESKTAWKQYIVFGNGTFYHINNGRLTDENQAKEFENM